MELKNFLKLFREFPQIDQTAKVLSRPNSHIHWKGHVGSSRSISAIAVAEQTPGHHVFILNDKEEAAYFLNDLEGLKSYSVPKDFADHLEARLSEIRKLGRYENIAMRRLKLAKERYLANNY